jgi:hypothetical protein
LFFALKLSPVLNSADLLLFFFDTRINENN